MDENMFDEDLPISKVTSSNILAMSEEIRIQGLITLSGESSQGKMTPLRVLRMRT